MPPGGSLGHLLKTGQFAEHPYVLARSCAVSYLPNRGFLALGTDISRGNGIGEFAIQVLDGLGRVAPGRAGTALTLSASPDLKLPPGWNPVSYTHLRAHETVLDLVCRLL